VTLSAYAEESPDFYTFCTRTTGGGRGSHTKLSRRVFLKQVNNITPSGNVINVRRRGCAANAFELEAKILILRRP
jgi:hypothetical protein